MDIKKLKLAIEQAQKVCTEMNKCANKFILQDSINEMNQALTIPDVVKSLPSRDDAVNYAANKLFDDEDVEYQIVLINPKESGYMTGFLDCHKWLTK